MNAMEYGSEHDAYIISITKDDNRWNVFAEDHEPEDMDNHPENGFKTLTEAKAFAEDFAEYFEHCQDEIAKSEIDEDAITGYIVKNVWDEAIVMLLGVNSFFRGDVADAIKFDVETAAKWLNELGEDWIMEAV
jgi:hypothetical protein